MLHILIRVENEKMNGNEYQKLAMRTANFIANNDYFNLSNVGLGLSGESGEVADYIKKVLHQGHEMDNQKLAYELGDVLWYVALGCQTINIGMDKVMEMNIEKLRKRYPAGFESEKSIDRESTRGI